MSVLRADLRDVPLPPGLFVTGTDTGVGKTRVTAGIVRLLRRSGHNVGALKPAASGLVPRTAGRSPDVTSDLDAEGISEDTQALLEALRTCPDHGVTDTENADINVGEGRTPLLWEERVTPFRFAEPLAPPIAARRAGHPLHWSVFRDQVLESAAWWAKRGVSRLLVEGVGGLLCPLCEEPAITAADLAVLLDFPIIVVARPGLGTLNHTLLTVEAAQRRGLRIAGVVINRASPQTEQDQHAVSVVETTNAQELARRLPGIPILARLPFDPDPAQATFLAELKRVDWFPLARAPRRTTPSAPAVTKTD